MKIKTKAIAAAVLAATLTFSAFPAETDCTVRLTQSVTAHAAFGSANLDEETGVLTLRGSVTRSQILMFNDVPEVRHIVAETGTVLPEDCSYLFADTERGGLRSTSRMAPYFNTVSIDFSKADTSRVKNMEGMFYQSYAKELDLSGFDTSGVTNMKDMFKGCQDLETVYVSQKWSMADITSDQSEMFSGCESIAGGCRTRYSEMNTGGDFARIDSDEHPGYFTYGGENYVEGMSLTLDGRIGVNFYTRLNPKTAKAVLEGPGEAVLYESEPMLRNAMQHDGRYKFTYYVNATQASAPITLKLYNTDGQQLDIFNSNMEKDADKTIEYSVNTYIADTAKYENTPAVHDLVHALDNYCQAAEDYFLGTAHYPEVAPAVVIKTNDYNKQFQISLVLNSETELRIYTESRNVQQLYFGTDPYGLDAEYTADGTQYYSIPLEAYNLRENIGIRIDGVNYKVCPMDYCALVFDDPDSSTVLRTVCAALYHYGVQAESYRAGMFGA